MGVTLRENEGIVRRSLTDVVDGGDTDAVEAFVTEDFTDHIVFGDECDRHRHAPRGADERIATGEPFAIVYVLFCRPMNGQIGENLVAARRIGLARYLGVLPQVSDFDDTTRHEKR